MTIILRPCGCQIEIRPQADVPTFKDCATHAAAPRMLDLIRALVTGFDGDTECTELLDMIGAKDSEARAILREIEGAPAPDGQGGDNA